MNIQSNNIDHVAMTTSISNRNHSNDLLLPFDNNNDILVDQHDGIYAMANDTFFSKRPVGLDEPTKITNNFNYGKIYPDDNTLSTAMLSDHTPLSMLKLQEITPTVDNRKSRKGKVILEEQNTELQTRQDNGQHDMIVKKQGITRKTSIRVRGGNTMRAKSSDSIVIMPDAPLAPITESTLKKHRSGDDKLTMSDPIDKGNRSTPAVAEVTALDQNVGTTAPALKRCTCSWKNCRAYQKAFRDAKHPVFDGVVTIKIFKDHPIGMNYKECLDRTLGVTKEPEWKKQQHNGSVKLFTKYVISKHHFTQSHMEKYDSVAPSNNDHNESSKLRNQNYSFLKPFSVAGAKKYLYKIDPNEVFIQPNDDKGTNNETFYMQCPNVPNEVVKMEFYKALEQVNYLKKNHVEEYVEDKNKAVLQDDIGKPPRSSQKQIMSPKKSNDRQITHISVGNTRGSVVSSIGDVDDDNELGFHDSFNKTRDVDDDDQTVVQIKVKDAENKELKDQLEFMQTQLSVLHDMVSKLQVQHFEQSYANGFGGGGSFSSNFNNSSRNKLSTLNQKKKSVQQQKQQQQYQRRATPAGGSRLMRSQSLEVPDEINVDDDDDSKNDDNNTMSTTDMYSRFGSVDGESQHRKTELLEDDEDEVESDDDDEEEDDLKTVATTGTFVSKYKQILKGSVEDDDDVSASSDDKQEVDTVALTTTNLSNSQQLNSSLLGSMTKQHYVVASDEKISTWEEEQSTSLDEIDQSLRLEDLELSRRNRVQKATKDNLDRSTNSPTRQVTNLTVADPYGEKGKYTGSIDTKTSMPHGYGRLNYEGTGRWYEGDWKYGRWTGRGQLANTDGDLYEGELLDDHKHGYGIMRFADGRIYDGQFKHGQMAKGKMTYKDGSYYDGSWLDGMRHGYGRCVFPDNSVYEGNFVNGEFHGKGKMMWNDNGWYYGDWNMGIMDGFGKEVLPNGSIRHDGKWKKGRPVRV